MADLNDEEFSAEELAEAQALAAVLDGGSLKGGSEAALEAAALLRVAQRPVLEPRRFSELRSEVLRSATSRRLGDAPDLLARGGVWALPSRVWLRWVWLRWAGLVVPAALLVFIGLRSWTWGSGSSASIVSDVTLPKPSVALLRSQAQALQGEQAGEYEEQLAAYRGQVLAVLEQRATAGGRF